MRIFRLLFSLLLTVGLVALLDVQLPAAGAKTPRLGMFLSPQKGFWQNAEAVNIKMNDQLVLKGLKDEAEVYFDERLVPHVYVNNDQDAYFVQGYLHAKHRLWQMEFQTHAAAGRLSEILGPKTSTANFLEIDVYFRRLGMVYAAEQSMKAMMEDEGTRLQMEAYTAGINSYIKTLKPEHYPVEYKLLNYKPEEWTLLKSALFLKYMSFDLAGFEEDFELTKARNLLSKPQFEMLYPYGSDSLDPIIPRDSLNWKSATKVQAPKSADPLYFTYKPQAAGTDTIIKPDKDNGSNNWAVHGSKTASGRPILCNDPHLGLNLPSLWYEMQISTPSYNAYGVTFPGAPSIIIGFNDSCAFGFTNAMRDVRDYYEIEYKDERQKEYMYEGQWRQVEFRKEVIKVKGKADTVVNLPMTIWGPVMYDSSYPDKAGTGKAWACRWKAHDASNELRTFTKLNYAHNLQDYYDAMSTYKCPGQNMLFATKAGDIALRQQGEFPAKWYRQGDFVMPGNTPEYKWQGNIPASMNYTMVNPARGFVSSANQLPYDTSYPYYLGGSYPPFRGYLINRYLANMQNITPVDMQGLMNSNHNLVAEWARPALLSYLDASKVDATYAVYLDIFKNWNLINDPEEKGATIFTCFWDSLATTVYSDELNQPALSMPETSTLLDALNNKPVYSFTDNINTSGYETWKEVVTEAFIKASKALWAMDNKEDALTWAKYKNSGVRHLLRIPAFSRLGLHAGGGRDIINAYKQYHGPSWKMVVHLTDKIEAYGIYPGGQNGNPGSKFYDNSVANWVEGKFYRLNMFTKQEMKTKAALGKITMKPA